MEQERLYPPLDEDEKDHLRVTLRHHTNTMSGHAEHYGLMLSRRQTAYLLKLVKQDANPEKDSG